MIMAEKREVFEMSNTRIAYFEEHDILHLSISDEPEAGSIELSPNVTAEINEKVSLSV
jgi:hypothetical protein